jgi:hypothetical protein
MSERISEEQLRRGLYQVVDLLRKAREGSVSEGEKKGLTFALQMIGVHTDGEFGECELEIPEAGAR